MSMAFTWDKISEWLTTIGLLFFGIGAVILMLTDGFAVALASALVFFVLSVVLQAFGIAAEAEAIHCLDREEEYAVDDERSEEGDDDE